MKKLFFPIFICFISLTLIQCSKQATEPEKKADRVFTPSEKKISQTSQSFGLKLFAKIQESDKNKNIFISPYSVSMALGMTLNGARNSTFTSMQQTLDFQGMTQEEINNAYKSLMDYLLQADDKVIFQAANSIWYRNGFSVLESFLNVNRNFFNASVTGLNFDDPASVAIINRWVSDNTREKIKTIIDSIDPDVVMYLINAIYFKGTWKTEFQKDKSYDGEFRKPDGSTKTVRMMKTGGKFLYQRNDSFEAIELPYGNGKFVMNIFLPAENTDVDAFIKSMNPAEWENLMNGFAEKEGNLDFPKFTLEYDLKMKEVLSAIGIQNAFNSTEADFSGINGNKGLYIGEVIHKTYVGVDEQGTEAAAVTAVIIERTSVGDPDSPFSMVVNRPFVFIIREKSSDAILFMGKIIDPQ